MQLKNQSVDQSYSSDIILNGGEESQIERLQREAEAAELEAERTCRLQFVEVKRQEE